MGCEEQLLPRCRWWLAPRWGRSACCSCMLRTMTPALRYIAVAPVADRHLHRTSTLHLDKEAALKHCEHSRSSFFLCRPWVTCTAVMKDSKQLAPRSVQRAALLVHPHDGKPGPRVLMLTQDALVAINNFKGGCVSCVSLSWGLREEGWDNQVRPNDYPTPQRCPCAPAWLSHGQDRRYTCYRAVRRLCSTAARRCSQRCSRLSASLPDLRGRLFLGTFMPNLHTVQSREATDAALKALLDRGIPTFAASGDDGARDGGMNMSLNADFPASSPFSFGKRHDNGSEVLQMCEGSLSVCEDNAPGSSQLGTAQHRRPTLASRDTNRGTRHIPYTPFDWDCGQAAAEPPSRATTSTPKLPGVRAAAACPCTTKCRLGRCGTFFCGD